MTKINSSGQTTLHLAVSEGIVKAVHELLENIKRDSKPLDVLNLKTKKGYTPLHFVASADGVTWYVMCRPFIDSVVVWNIRVIIFICNRSLVFYLLLLCKLFIFILFYFI